MSTISRSLKKVVCEVREAVAEYRAAGLATCRVRPGEKRPSYRGWSTGSLEPTNFRPGDSVGIVCGWPSDCGRPGFALVCVDLDSAAVLALADECLPPTGMVAGRPGKPRSHRYYLVPTDSVPGWATSQAEQAAAAARAAGKHPGPWKKQFANRDGVQIDFLGTGGQAAAPPSLHPSGERRTWEGGRRGDPAVVPFSVLWRAVVGMAVAVGCPDPTPVSGGRRRASAGVVSPPDWEALLRAADAGESVCVGGRWWLPQDRERLAGDHLRRELRRSLPRSGHGGHDACFRLLRLCANDYLVRDREALRGFAGLVNREIALAARRSGDDVTYETWSQKEMEHKIDDALARVDPDHPPGRRLEAVADRASRPGKQWHHPDRLAESFLAGETVVFVRDRAYAFAATGYEEIRDDALQARMWRHAEASRHGRGRPIDQRMVGNAMAALRARRQLPDDTTLNTWLPTGRPRRLLATPSGLLDLDTIRPGPDGGLDLDGVSVRAHTPDWVSTTVLPVRFDPAAPPPARLRAYLERVTSGDGDVARVLQEVAGACLDPWLRAKFFACLAGEGNNGKSVYLAVLRALLGPANVSAVALDELTKNRFASFGLYGRLANLVGDQGYLEPADEGRLKALTGGDLVPFEAKGKDPVFAPNTAKLVFACNAMPRFADKTHALWDRLVAVPFRASIPAAERDPTLLDPETWADVMPGVLLWALEGLARLRANAGFTRAKACDDLRDRHRLESNPARLFLVQHCRAGKPEHYVVALDVYQRYTEWCRENGVAHPLSSPNFGKEVGRTFRGARSKSFRVSGRVVRGWSGVSWRGDVTG